MSYLARQRALFFKITVSLAAAAAILLCWLPPAGADSGTITGSVVNIRQGPATTYEVSGNLLQGTRVSVLEEKDGWYRVGYDNRSGWINGRYIEVKQDPQVQVIETLVNLRSGPGTGYEIVSQARRGERLYLLEAGADWSKVQNSNGLVCYVASSLVQSGPASPNPATQPPSASASASGDIQVYLDGQLLSFDVPPQIENDRTLVPLRGIFEAMGASVDWDDAARTVTARREGVVIVLPIGSANPTVNGAVWPLDVPAKIVGGRTLAPLRFVGEGFGGQVSWNETSRTVTIDSPEPAAAPAVALPQSPSLTVRDALVNLRSGPGTSYAQVSSACGGEVLPILGQQDGWFQISRGGSPAWIAGWLVDLPGSGVDQPAVGDDELVWYNSSKDDGGFRINIESGSRLNADIEENGNSVVYTIRGRSLKGNTPLNVSLGGRNLNVQGENRNGDAVITVTLPAGLKYRTEQNNDGKRESVVIENRILEISRKVFGNIGDNIIVYTLTPCEYTYSLKKDILEIKLKSTYQGVDRSTYNYPSSALLEKMTIQESSGAPPLTTLRIETKNLGDYRIFQTSDDNALNIVLTSDRRSEDKTNKLVVLDPGHGGRDTGANGSYLHEKDVNLDIALQAGKILSSRGFDIAYTRDDDTYLTQTERCTIANQLNAAVFVAVHCNSSTTPTSEGTETYYYASLDDPALFMQKDQRAELAGLLQKNLVAKLQRLNRGVKQSNFTVITGTDMPSALIETAFINNPVEEACLADSGFRSRAARAVADAITEYMNSR
jgi:N-acetylmuramoyl-L-alanine amidase